MNDRKMYEPISYDDQVSEQEKFTDKAHITSRGKEPYIRQ